MSTVMMRVVRVLLSLSAMMTVAALSSATEGGPAQPAQSQPTPAPSAAPPAATGQPPSKPAEAVTPFTYNPEGRRDPFVSLIGKGNDPKNTGARPPGIPGLLINEVSVKGIVRN